MDLPFSREEFFTVFVRYNVAVWPLQFVLHAAALAVVALLFVPSAHRGRIIATLLCRLWTWAALAYHAAFFTAINPAAWLFAALFLLQAALLARFGVFGRGIDFELRPGVRGAAGGALLAYALLLYPGIGALVGHRFPAARGFGLPCPTTIFTIGLLLLAKAPLPRALLVVPVNWSAIGSLAAFTFGVYQDLGLLIGGVAAVALGVRARGAPVR